MSIQKRAHGVYVAPENSGGRDFVVGDLHGQFDLLMDELERVGFVPDRDRLFCSGDLVDRGEQSMECLRLLSMPWFYSTLGNHEDMMISAVLDGDLEAGANWLCNGGRWAHEQCPDEIADLVARWMLGMPLAIEIPFQGRWVGLIHAAVTSGEWGVFDLDADVWNRRVARDQHRSDAVVTSEVQVAGIDAVVVGHNITPAPMVRGNTLFMDTGAAVGRMPTVWPIEAVLNVVDRHAKFGKAQTFFYVLSQNVAGHTLNDL